MNSKFPSVQYIKGVGPRRGEALESAGIKDVRDLLYYFPRGYLDLSRVEKIGSLWKMMNNGQWVTVIGTVRSFDLAGRPPKQRFVLILEDDSGNIPLTFFHKAQYYKDAFEVGETLAVSGRVTDFRNRPQMIHPAIDRLSGGKDTEEPSQKFLHTKGIIPQYSSTEELRRVGLESRGFRRIIKTAVEEYAKDIEEFLPKDITDRNLFMPLSGAIQSIHFPKTESDLDGARRRLKFDELFALQLLLALRRKSVKIDEPGIAFNTSSKLARKLVDSLPFKLTNAQVRVIREIAEDMASGKPMNRLLQGDVGSGKTIVALTAILIAIENGYQAAFMAPTEILAEQHYQTIASFLKDFSIDMRLLVSGQRKRLREDILESVREGHANLIVGTHALIQEGVEFSKLGLVVIDEQHRFGVVQRAALKEKGAKSQAHGVSPDVLVMTATPIPRTLALTIYGDLDVSTINEMPKHRKPIKTFIKPEAQRQSLYSFVREEIKKGRQAYIVYPLVEESEKMDLKAAMESYEVLRSEVFPDLKVGLIHGRMTPDEKDEVMQQFKAKELDVLVATTVIEVGIDVPNASVMVIEHAERFGLSQLHQLRGRVGRGAEQSYCILMTPNWLRPRSKNAPMVAPEDPELEARLKTERRLASMEQTTDGFKIAEIDLELRGPGDFFGTRQSGLPELQIANLVTDTEILSLARKEAFAMIDDDPQLERKDHQPVKNYFEGRMKDALALLNAG
jgi:ATP-dependent DNA helicase RecG